MEENQLKIKKITITGMHGVVQKSYTLNDDITYFVGPNGAGKSTILQAIQLGLLGYIPGYSKTNETMMKHASSPVMSVTLELEGGITVHRGWWKSGSSITSKHDVKGYTGKIEDLVSEIELPIFNFNEFRSMTANKLKEWFISFLPQNEDGIDLEHYLVEEANKKGIEYEEQLIRARDFVEGHPAKGVELVKALNGYFKDEQTYVKGQIAKLQGTVESLIRYDDVDCSDDSFVRQQIADTESTWTKMLTYEAQKSAQEKLNSDIAQLKLKLPAKSFEEDSRVVKLNEQKAGLEKELDSAQAELSADNSSNEKAEEIRNQIKIMKADYEDIQKEIIELMKQKASMPTAESTCPYTKDKCETAAKLSAKFKKDIEAIDKQIAFKQDEAKDYDMSKVNELTVQLSQIETDSMHARSAIQSKIYEFRYSISDIEQQVEAVRNEYKSLDTMVSQLIDIGPVPSELSSQELSSKLSELRSQLTKIEANKRYESLVNTVTSDKFKLENELELLKAWAKLTDANGLQSSLMNKPFEGLESDMSKYLTAMFGKEIQAKFNLVSKANSFSFGLVRNDQYIEFDCLSSGEKCLFTLALIMCILDRSQSEIRTIIIDDILDHLDSANASHMFEALKKVSNIQFILAGVQECSDKSICQTV